MTSVLRRIVELIRASLNTLIDRAEDPEKMLEQMMRDLQASYDRSRTEVARVLGEKHRLAAQLQSSDLEARDWERKAVLALKAGDEALARKALERKRAVVEVADGYRAQVEEQTAVSEKLKDALRALENKLSEARVKRSLLSARHKRAMAQRKIHIALEAAGSTTAFDNLARLESRIGELEAEGLAAAELSTSPLEARFRELDASDVEDDLLRLKARLTDGNALAPERASLPPAST